MIRTTATFASAPRRADPPAAFVAFFSRRRLRGSIAPAAVDSLASAIQTQEGYYPGSLAYVNNNPGNLIYAGQPGATQGAGGFASFSSYPLGVAALKNQITLDATRGTDANGNPVTNISQLISSWAPASDGNDTAAYISSVTSQTGYDPAAPLSSLGVSMFDGSSAAVDDSSLPAFSFSDLSSYDPSIDLSSVGGPSSVPALYLAGGALVGALLLSRLF
ncbi:MAG TPA: hypothetical protein VHZ25_03985 [Acidobacteriaceae bacterium]|nr:hypothetical protein [Acidobacteriaceae bacterium]